MNINLGAQWQAFVESRVQSGRYVSASEVVREGLRLLEEREQFQALRLDTLRKELERGIASLEQHPSPSMDLDELKAFLTDVDARGRARLGGAASQEAR